MELIFLSEQTFEILNHAWATDDFDIILDALVPQKSSFVVNKQSLNAKIGDLIVVRDEGYPYIGFITSIELDEKNRNNIKAKDFLSIFDLDVPVPTSFTGNVAQFLVDLINSAFKHSGDSYQNLSYLQCTVEVAKSVTLKYEADTKMNILDLVEEFSKTYGVRLEYEMVVANGRFSKVNVKVVSSKVGLRIKSDLGTITNLVINDANDDSLNKVVYVPKSENITHTSTITYFLYSDGSIGTYSASTLRIPKVKVKYEFYSDKDYESLSTKANKALIDSSLDHSITFNYSAITNKIASFEFFRVGTVVEFITPTKTYVTLVTKMEFKGNFNVAKVTLGEYRLSLTDKLKLFDRRK